MCTRLNSISQVSQCNLFNGTDLTERDPGQKCSIAEEVANGREVAECTNKLQVSEASVYVVHLRGVNRCKILMKVRF